MKQQLKWLAIILITAVTVIGTVFSAFAAPELPPVRPAAAAPIEAPSDAFAPPAACSRMQASDVAWVTLTDEGSIDEQVGAYPRGTTLITPVFQYNCVPSQVTIVTVFTFNGDSVFTDKQPMRASSRKGLYGFPLSSGDAPFDEGEWGVEFYNNKSLLTSGVIVVGQGGGGQSAGVSATVNVEGTVTDKKSRRAIRGAIVLVLNPGVTVQDFLNRGKKDADVFTGGRTDSRGRFALDSPLERNTPYSILIVARGYQATGADGLTVSDEVASPLALSITMTR